MMYAILQVARSIVQFFLYLSIAITLFGGAVVFLEQLYAPWISTDQDKEEIYRHLKISFLYTCIFATLFYLLSILS